MNVLLLGAPGASVRDEWVHRRPELGERVFAPGPLSETELSNHLGACDLMVQPFPDGVTVVDGGGQWKEIGRAHV